MDEHTLRDLEYDKLLEILEGLTLSPMGRDGVRRLRPITNPEEIERLLSETVELQHILSQEGDIPLHSIKDIRTMIKALEKGLSHLGPKDFLALRDTLLVSESIRTFFDGKDGVLADKALSLPVLTSLRERIEETIDGDGTIKDDASVRLRELRQGIGDARGQARKILEGLLKKKGLERAFSERGITIRKGRYVLPVKREYQHLLPGIVHDESQSGATYYVEPMEVVAINNRITLLHKECEEEERRVLEELTSKVREEVETLKGMVEELTSWEVLYAKARLGVAFGSSRPILSRDGAIDLKGARHPLLLWQGREVVPVDIGFGDEKRVLVISGANAGGKTVSLKTLGLLILMVQTGITIPARGDSRVALFERVLAQVGDDQSIERSMSTFSAHVERLAEMVKMAGKGSLILIDEIGAGTDPSEGASLSLAVLKALKRRGAKVVVTTHYPQLKAFAHEEGDAENLSVEFDDRTSRPTYRLVKGVPGASNALSTARAYGMPEEVVEEAASLLKGEDMGLAELISSLEEERRLLKEELERVKDLRTSLEGLERKRDEALKRLMERRRAILEETRRKAGEALRAFKRELDRALERAKEGEKVKREVEEAYRRTFREEPRKGYRPVPGEMVFLPVFKEKGKVKRVEGGMAEVDTGRFRVKVPFSQLEPFEGEGVPQAVVSINLRGPAVDVPMKINLIGQRVEEALKNLDSYLDKALLKGFERVEIIHGKGEGILRRAIHQYLGQHPCVVSFRLFGLNEGVTEVNLKV